MLSRRPPLPRLECLDRLCFQRLCFVPTYFRAVPPSSPAGRERKGGRGEGEGALAVLYSTGAEPDATRFRRVSVHLRPGSQLRRT
jgi:hypothetical protein